MNEISILAETEPENASAFFQQKHKLATVAPKRDLTKA